MSNRNGFFIGGANPESVKSLSETILAVLSAPHTDERTKQLALKTLGKGVEAPSHMTVSNCHVEMPTYEKPTYNYAGLVEEDELGEKPENGDEVEPDFNPGGTDD